MIVSGAVDRFYLRSKSEDMCSSIFWWSWPCCRQSSCWWRERLAGPPFASENPHCNSHHIMADHRLTHYMYYHFLLEHCKTIQEACECLKLWTIYMQRALRWNITLFICKWCSFKFLNSPQVFNALLDKNSIHSGQNWTWFLCKFCVPNR